MKNCKHIISIDNKKRKDYKKDGSVNIYKDRKTVDYYDLDDEIAVH